MKNILSIRIEQDQIDRLRAIEERDGVNVAEQVRRAIGAYLAQARHGKPGPREFKGKRGTR